jgi:hypothetical protein
MKHLNIDGGDDVEVIIMSGVQALGRNAELQKINQTMQELQMLGQLVGPEQIARAMNTQGWVAAIVSNSGVANQNLIVTKTAQAEEIGAEKTEQMSQEALQQTTKSAGKMAEQGNL